MRDDSELIKLATDGDTDAFSQLVRRYQGLVCAVSYSAVGDFSSSEDVAQETFFTAWKKLGDLREPSKFPAWICSIARNAARNVRRKGWGAPEAKARSIEDALTAHDASEGPLEKAINREEEQLVWRTLSTLPPKYREPLVLYYREHASAKSVAEVMGISEAAARQRISRGRGRLKREVAQLVRSALERTGPRAAFTIAVVAALPALAPQASATAGTAGVAAGAGIGASVGGFLHDASRMFFTFLVLPLAGLFLAFDFYREVSGASSRREKRVIIGYTVASHAVIFILCFAAIGAVVTLARPGGALAGRWLPLVIVLLPVIFAVGLGLVFAKKRAVKRIKVADGTWREPPRRTVTTRVLVFSIALCAPLFVLALAAFVAGMPQMGAFFGIGGLIMTWSCGGGFRKAKDPRRHLTASVWAMAGLTVLFWSRWWPEIAAAWQPAGAAVVPLWAVVAFWMAYLGAAYVFLKTSLLASAPSEP